jgi:anti-anti-sigma factor
MPTHPAARWHIRVTVERDGQSASLTFDHSPVTIGGAPTNDVVLGGPHISRTHSTVALSGGQLLYRDQSSNGSFLNGQRIDEVPLDPTDVIVVRPYRLTFVLLVQPERPTVRLDDWPFGDKAPASPEDDRPTLLLYGRADQEAPAPDNRDVSPDAASPQSFELQLIKVPDELQQRTFSFDRRFADGELITIGRAPDAHVTLDLQSVSRRHAVIMLVAGAQWLVKDLGSRNGIEVNGQSVSSAMLADGDEIAFGPDVTAVFRQPLPAAVAEPRLPAPVAADSSVSRETLSIGSHPSTWSESVTVVAVSGRIDGYNYPAFRDHLNRVIDNGERLLIVDFSLCPFCDHAGLGVLLSTKAALDKRKGRLCLIGLNQMLSEGLSLLGLRSMLAIELDEAAAVRRLLAE